MESAMYRAPSRNIVVTLALLLPIVTSAEAETLGSIKELKPGTNIHTYIFSREQVQELYNIGVFWDKKLGLQQNCKSQFHVKPTSFVILAPINLPDGQLHPTEGAWKHRFQFERCGEIKIYNAVFIAKSGAKPEVRPYFPGTTNASPQLINDAMRGAVAQAFVNAKKENSIADCKDVVLTDMNVTQLSHDVVDAGKTFTGVWQESWSFLVCGQPVNVLLNFTPDGKGGAFYSIKNK